MDKALEHDGSRGDEDRLVVQTMPRPRGKLFGPGELDHPARPVKSRDRYCRCRLWHHPWACRASRSRRCDQGAKPAQHHCANDRPGAPSHALAAGLGRKEFAGLQRLKRHGLYFNCAYTAVTQCSPSRALMMTGRFAPVNRATQTFLWPGLVHQDRQPNIASLLKEKAGCEVVWKGEWHLSWASNAATGSGGEDWREADASPRLRKISAWTQWNPPDAGNAIETWQPTEFGKFNGPATLGGADPDNDGRYVNGVQPGARGQTPGSARASSSS